MKKKLTFDEEIELLFTNKVEKIIHNYKNQKQHKCCFPNCNNQAVSSHAISKNISLYNISFNGHTLGFESFRKDKFEKALELNKISIDDATTFKGFCPKHESDFKVLDENSSRYTYYEILLQAYRSICFSYFHSGIQKEIDKEKNEFIKNEITNEYLIKLLKNSGEFDNLELDYLSSDKELSDFKKQLVGHECINLEQNLLNRYKIILENQLNNLHDNDKKSQNEIICCCYERSEFDLTILYRKFDFKIPVAMVNHFILSINSDCPTILLCTCIPYEDTMEMYWIFEKKYRGTFLNKWYQIILSKINLLNFIENSMICSENWYVSPCIIENLTEQKRKLITDDVYYLYNRTPFDIYDLSIFDAIRCKLVEDEKYKLETEKNKINAEVVRPSHEQREQSFIDAVKKTDTIMYKEVKKL
ncbi:hypothetical protein DSECCO2_416290 [anaerobic digester metagenome]